MTDAHKFAKVMPKMGLNDGTVASRAIEAAQVNWFRGLMQARVPETNEKGDVE